MTFRIHNFASTVSWHGRLARGSNRTGETPVPRWFTRFALSSAFILVAASGIGCQQSNSSTAAPSAGPSFIVDGAKPYAPLPTTAQVLKVSRLPINYIVSPGGLLRVRDLTAGTELAVDVVLSSTVVRIDPGFGIYFGNTQTYTKKLDPTHRYQLSLDPTVHQILEKK